MLTGALMHRKEDIVILNKGLTDSSQRLDVDRKELKSIEPSKFPLMRSQLFAQLSKKEGFDFVAYLLRGRDDTSTNFAGRP